jgi:hypothetical protein
MTLNELGRIKKWLVGHRHTHPVEYHLWDAMLMLWLVGWVGWIPTLAFHMVWATPLCIAAMFAPTLYATWRSRAHRARRLRCDWLTAWR